MRGGRAAKRTLPRSKWLQVQIPDPTRTEDFFNYISLFASTSNFRSQPTTPLPTPTPEFLRNKLFKTIALKMEQCSFLMQVALSLRQNCSHHSAMPVES